MAADAGLHSLKLADYADPELLAIINDVADDDGWASTYDVARTVGFPESSATAHRCVASRLSWMRRWEWIERHPDYSDSRWRLTAIGHELLSGKMTAILERQLDRAKPADRIKIVRRIGQDTQRSGQAARQMARREWRRAVELSPNGANR